MKLIKIETNFRRKLFFHESYISSLKEMNSHYEKELILIYPEVQYQEIIGFGGALTESSAYNYSLLPKQKQQDFLEEYFGEHGIGYSFCRTSIGSSDFSLKPYSYLYDDNLEHFSIDEDQNYVIPFIKQCQNMNPGLILLASPWSPPAFMKDNHRLTGGGKLLKEDQSLYAGYLLSYLKAYEKEGLPISYMSIQNEPNATQAWESCLYSAEEEANLIKNYLHPLLIKHHMQTKLLIWDHNKERLFLRARDTFSYQNTSPLIAGVAYHWYSGDYFENIDLVRQCYPDKLLIHTEGCTGYSHFKKSQEVPNAEIYGHDILNDLNAGANGYIDWNVLLDYRGGPNHKQNYCNSPIMLTKKKDDFRKNLSFYYIGHFSKYIKPHAKRIAFSKFVDKIEVTAFQNPDESLVVVLLNRNDQPLPYHLCIKNKVYQDRIDAHAIVTLKIS